MPRPLTTAELDREAYLVRELRTLATLIKDARAKGHATALVKHLARQDSLHAELGELRRVAAEVAAAASRVRPADMSPEAWAARVAADAAEADDDDLDIYMGIWARRRGYLVEVVGGEVRLVRRRQA